MPKIDELAIELWKNDPDQFLIRTSISSINPPGSSFHERVCIGNIRHAPKGLSLRQKLLLILFSRTEDSFNFVSWRLEEISEIFQEDINKIEKDICKLLKIGVIFFVSMGDMETAVYGKKMN